ncbi:MAG: DUF4982 domain-containing protein [Oscillospiraceae bacterium]|nr:DUF4982 domain-containing protein [Oscillospiraceae bacterium]
MAHTEKINENWKFHLGDAPGADYMGYDDSAWRTVTLPHDWAVEHPFSRAHSSGTGYLPGGTAIYRKHFILPDNIKDKRVRINFDGVYKHSRVWINSNYLGSRASGYSPFSFDISDFVRPGENVLAVRVEHNETADSRWYTGSGIYRDVVLSISSRFSFAENGIFIEAKNISENAAEIVIEYTADGCDAAEFALIDKFGSAVARVKSEGEKGKAFLSVKKPELWSPDEPYLYSVCCQTLKNGEITDTETIPFGIRSLRFDANEGFFLNGVNTKIKGVCFHHDAGCLGAAVSESVWERRLKKLKAAGCNAVRTAHNPPFAGLLSLCDRLGLMVMDEAFDEWEGAKNKWWQGHNVYPPKRYGYAEDFPLWHKEDLKSMVLRDRNHPSVIMWSIGNEIDYPNDPYVTPYFDEVLGNNDNGKPAEERRYNDKKPDASRLPVVSRELVSIVRKLDAGRPVLSAMSFPELSTLTGFAQTLDIWGYNYRENLYEQHHKSFPEAVIFGSENSHSPEAWFSAADNSYICGQFLWTGIDFLGECAGWPVRISQAGMLDLCGYEKPLYYQRKALWTNEPFAKLAVSKTQKRGVRGDNYVYSGIIGETLFISCYTNEENAELFINGKSAGKKSVDKKLCRVTWEIEYVPGEISVKTENAFDILYSAEEAKKIILTPEKEVLSDGDIVHIEVSLEDKNGHIASAEDKEVYYQLLGDAEILGIENGKPDDLTPYSEKFRTTYNGRALVYLRAGSLKGKIKLFAYAKCGIAGETELIIK